MSSPDNNRSSKSVQEIDPEELKASGLDRLRFDNRFLDGLPTDSIAANQPRQVVGAMTSRVKPAPVSAPKVIGWSPEVSAMVGIDAAAWTEHADLLDQVFSGTSLLPGMDPHAACYGGHQFGHWAGQLGDGRAMSLGEVLTTTADDDQRLTLQLKGAGPTPYSRTADGLAVLRSSVREFLCSEAMHHLGIATTRALSLVSTGDKVVRDMFYDGNPRPEPGAIVCRVAPSFIRFGNFQIFASRGELDELRQLADFTIEHYFKHLLSDHAPGSAGIYAAMFDEVCRTTLATMIGWMRVGFVHGVMNTDNMSIHGATIDYGPYGWLEGYDPDWTPNTTDAAHRRYRYGQQPLVGQWNLLQLANSLVTLSEDPGPFEESLQNYGTNMEADLAKMWRAKIGLDGFEVDDKADHLVNDLLPILSRTETDMPIFFRRLATIGGGSSGDGARDGARDGQVQDDEDLVAPLLAAYYTEAGRSEVRSATADWLRRYQNLIAEVGVADEQRGQAMNAQNPKYVLRNYIAQLAIDAAEQNDFSMIEDLLELFRNPYDEQPDRERFAVKRPEWARERPGCSMLSCSS